MTPIDFKHGLHRTGPIDIDAVRRRAEQDGIATFVLPITGIVDKPSFFSAVQATLPLDPPFTGSRSWDGLSDSLWEGLYRHPGRRIAVVWQGGGGMATSASHDFEIALEVMAHVARGLADPRATAGAPKEVVFLVE
jgi:hypothetical protein